MQKFNDLFRSSDGADAPGLLATLVRASLDSLAMPPTGKERRGGRAGEGFAGTIGILSLAAVLLLALTDYLASPRITFNLFYFLVVSFAAWNGGRKTGGIVAVVSSLAVLMHEIHTSGWTADWSIYGNWLMEALIFLFAARLVSALRSLAVELERRVKDRTLALEREVGDRRQTEEQLRKTMQQFRQLAENISDAFWMREVGDTRMVYVSPAYEKIWGRSCKTLYQSGSAWLEAIHPEDRDAVAQAIGTKQTVGEYNQEYRILRNDGSLRWIRDRAFPIQDGFGKVVRIVGIAEDITDRRRMEREILEISDREQGRIGQDLHDGLCQKLVSIAFDNNSLEQKLTERTLPEAANARQIAELLDEAITEARAMAHGLFPVQLEADGLDIALQQLAEGANARAGVTCRLECPRPALVRQNAVATHLYRIAQEAVNNAIKHAQAGSILIELKGDEERVELRVTDDGVGMPGSPAARGGLGLHIMDYRARTIGGTLDITRATSGGTSVSCSAPQQT